LEQGIADAEIGTAYEVVIGKLKGRDIFGDLGIDGRIILK
jgi:hypothetical protein